MGSYEAIPIHVSRHIRHVVVVEPGSAEPGIVQHETHWLNQVQPGASIGAQAYDVARVWWNLGLIQDYVDQERDFLFIITDYRPLSP